MSIEITVREATPWPALRISVRGLAEHGEPKAAERCRCDPIDNLLLRTVMRQADADGSYAIGPREFAPVLALLRQHSTACQVREGERIARVRVATAPPDVTLAIAQAAGSSDAYEGLRIEACVHFRCAETGQALSRPLCRTEAYWTFEDCIAPPPALPADPVLRDAVAAADAAPRNYQGAQAWELLHRARAAARDGCLAVRLDARLAALAVALEPLRIRDRVRFNGSGDLCIQRELLTPDGRVVPAAALAARQGPWVSVEGRTFFLPEQAGGTPAVVGERILSGDAIADFLADELPRLKASGAAVAPDVEAARVWQSVRPAVAVGPAEHDGECVQAQWFLEPLDSASSVTAPAAVEPGGAAERIAPLEILGAAARGQRYLRRGNVFVRVDREAVNARRREASRIEALRGGAGEARGEEIPELLAWARTAASDVETPWNVYVAQAVAGAHKITDEPATIRLQFDVDEEGSDAWFGFSAAFDHGGETLSEEELRQLVRQGRKWFRRGNAWIKVDSSALRKFAQNVRRSGALPYWGRGGHARYRFRPAARERVTQIFSVAGTVAHAERYRKFLDRLRGFERVEPVSPPAGLRLSLRSYQQQGFEWLAFLAQYGLNGILADDMGLGKTAQALAILARLKEQFGPAPALVVAPTSLLDNWRAEVAKFCPDLRVLIYRGTPERRDWLRRQAHEHDIVLGTYATVRNDAVLLRGIEWRYVILDEAHFIKNSAAATTKALKTIGSAHRLALTGTPIQNRLAELWSLFDFLMPGFLGRQTPFREQWEEPITRLQAGQAESEEERLRGQEALEGLRERIRPFVLRRLKTDVARELPPKIENDIFCRLTPEQTALYQGFADSAEAKKAVEELSTHGPDGARTALLAALMALRKICNHADLMFLPRNAGRQRIGQPLPGYEKRSGKLEALGELMRQCREGGHRALVFCQLTSMLDLIEHDLARQGFTWLRLDGETPAPKRQGLVDRFNADSAVDAFLISTRAGGTGLNLTGADTVIFYDHDWNPASDQQAQDRAHRIGQQRTVTLYRLICRGTFEEKLLRRQELKRLLAASIVPAGAAALAGLSRDELLGLFTLSADDQRA